MLSYEHLRERERDLEHFLHEKACVYEKSSVGRTFLFIDAEALQRESLSIMGFFTIGLTSCDISQLSQKQRRRILGAAILGRDRLSSFSAFLIGQLGRADFYSGADLPGEKFLEECYLCLKQANRYLGGEHVLLECRQNMFEKFYREQGFKKIVDEADHTKLVTLYNRLKFSEM